MTGTFDLLILNLGLPGRDGFSVLRGPAVAIAAATAFGVFSASWRAAAQAIVPEALAEPGLR
jgi:hypothetical protein